MSSLEHLPKNPQIDCLRHTNDLTKIAADEFKRCSPFHYDTSDKTNKLAAATKVLSDD